MSGLGRSFMKMWTCGSSPWRGSRNAWTWIKNVSGVTRLSNFGIFFFGAIQMISCHDWWPWRKPDYVTMTRKQSNNQWSGGIGLSPPQKIPCAKIRWKISPHWLPSKGPNYQRGLLRISSGAIEGHFEGKMLQEVHQEGLVLAWQCPASPGTWTQKKLAYLGFWCLDHPPYPPDLPLSTTTFSVDSKSNWKVAIFRPTRRSLLARRPGWTGNVWIFFFWVVCKS